MIQPNELRIGNWVNEDVLGDMQISAISHNWCSVKGKHMDVDKRVIETDYNLHLTNAKPIPLTPEILEKAGFEKAEHESFSSGQKQIIYSYRKNDITYNAFQDAWWYGGVLKVQPKYLHQLQNLYFALIGEELNITL